MTTVLRTVAVVIALLAILDPAMAMRASVPIPIRLSLPPASDPERPNAEDLARELDQRAAGIASTKTDAPPRVHVLLGRAEIPRDLSVPVLWLAFAPATPGVTIASLTADPAVLGQSVNVQLKIDGRGLAGRRSTITLIDRGIVAGTVEHRWREGDGPKEIAVPYLPTAAGVHRMTAQISTEGLNDVRADVAAVVTERRLRVLFYEPRPSWAVAFLRRTIETDPVFSVSSRSRSATHAATVLSSPPRSLAELDPGSFDVLVVGAPEGLTATDLEAINRFTTKRGGAVLLLPDRRLTPSVEAALGVPAMEERLSDKPQEIRTAAGTLRASELLLAVPGHEGDAVALATTHGVQPERAVVIAVAKGEGTLVISGLMDAWRHRAGAGASDAFWRGLVADLAVAAPSRLNVRVEPALTRPGERVRIVATWRQDALTRTDGIRVPATSATITDGNGASVPIRLWPAARAGEYEAWIDAPQAGNHVLSVSGDGVTADAVLVTDPTVISAMPSSNAQAAAATLTGGAVVKTVDELIAKLRAMDPSAIGRPLYPMRSPLWMIPFAACLCGEWYLRRRRGQR